MDVGFAGAVVAALHGVVEETVYAVAVVGVVLGRVDAALSRDRVRDAGILKAERLDVITQFGERGGGGAPASPVPTTITSRRRLLAGLTRRTEDLRLVHLSAIGPVGIPEFSLGEEAIGWGTASRMKD